MVPVAASTMAPRVAMIDLTTHQPIDQPVPKRLPKAGRVARAAREEQRRQEEAQALQRATEAADAWDEELALQQQAVDEELARQQLQQQQEFEAWHAERRVSTAKQQQRWCMQSGRVSTAKQQERWCFRQLRLRECCRG